MPFTVIATVGHHLEEGLTYIYQITQTQVVKVTVFSATRISFPPDSRAHSSRKLNILMWRTTKSLESANDNRRQQVKLHDDLNHLLGYNFFKSLTFISIFYIEIHHFLLPATKANYKIPVETILHYLTMSIGEIFSSKVPHFIIHTVLGSEKAMAKQ